MTADKIKELIGPIHGISLIEDFIIDEAGSLKGRIAVVTDQEHAGKSSVSCPLKPSDSTPLKHSTMPP